MRPTLRQLQYIVSIAETGKFADAARRLNVSQPSLSAQIADVEARLGVSLIERGRAGAFMTPIGHEFVRRAREILKHVEDLNAAMAYGDGAMAGRIRLGVIPSIGAYLLPSAVKSLHAEYPDLRMSVREERTIDLESDLKDGTLDTIISTAEDHPDTVAAPLFKERLWICAAADDPIAGAGPVKPREMNGRAMLTVGSGHRLSVLVQQVADASGAHISSEYEGTSLDAIRQMAAMGAGLAVLPSLYATSEARRDADLILRPIDHPQASREISLIWRRASPLAASFEKIAAVLSASAKSLLAQAAADEAVAG